AHAPNVEEPISSPVLELVVQPVQTTSPIGSPSHLDIPSFSTTSSPQNIASTFDPLLSEVQFDAFTDFEAKQHHDQATGGSQIYEHPPIPNPATPPVSTTEGAVEVPFTIDQMLALFTMCLQKNDALEKELKATKKLNRDTVLLFHKRIKKLEAKVKIKSKRKLVISDSEEEEAVKDYAELEKLIHLAEAAVNEPSSFILTGGKLDPSKISKSPADVAQRSVQTFLRKRSTKSTQGLDYSDVDFSPKDSVATDRFVPTKKVIPADKGVSAASSNKGKGIAVPTTGSLPSIQRQKDLDDMIARFSNTEWMILMAKVKDFPKVAKEILGADRYRAQQAKPMTRGDTVKYMRTYIKNMSAAYYSSGRTMEWANKFKDVKRSRPILAPGSPKKRKSTTGPSLGYTPADEVPADTGVSTDETVPVDQRVPADQGVPADASIPAVTGVSADATVPADQRVPADQGVPADASIPAVTGVSTDATIPADQHVPADQGIPADTYVSTEAATTTIPVNAPLDEDEPAEELSSLRRLFPLAWGPFILFSVMVEFKSPSLL
nr:hypothetical protein [Tanacetum cinerariifolium]